MITDGLYSYVMSNSAVTDIIGDRFYETSLPQDPTNPSAVYLIIGEYPVDTLSGKATLQRTRVQIDCYANTSRNAKLLADAIRDALVLDTYAGVFMGTHSVGVVRVIEHGMADFDDVPGDFRITSDYEIWHDI